MNVFKKSLKVSLKSFPSAAVWNELFMCISLRFGNTLISGTSAEAVSCVPGGPLDRCVVVVPIIYQGTGGDVLTPNLNNVISHVQCWVVCRALRHNHTADKRHDGDRVLEEQHLENSVWETKSQTHQKFRSHSTWGRHVRDGFSHPKQTLQSETWCQAVQQFVSVLFVLSLMVTHFAFLPGGNSPSTCTYSPTACASLKRWVLPKSKWFPVCLMWLWLFLHSFSRWPLKDMLDEERSGRENLVASHETERRRGRPFCQGLV